MPGDPTFGERMAQARREGNTRPAGRPPMRSKYKRQIEAAEGSFAKALPKVADDYIAELSAKDPERCPVHKRVLCCPVQGCSAESTRTAYNHQAAVYVFDRLAGKPTNRSENSLTVRFVEQCVEVLVGIFRDVNGIEDRDARQLAFADRLIEYSADLGGGAARG